jgi:hypothetical protein
MPGTSAFDANFARTLIGRNRETRVRKEAVSLRRIAKGLADAA